MKKYEAFRVVSLFLVCGVLLSCSYANRIATNVLQTEMLQVHLEKGQITSLIDSASGKEYLPEGQPAPLLTIRSAGTLYIPASMTRNGQKILLDYDKVGVKVEVVVEERMSHITFEVVSVSPLDKVELVLWGPYPTTIKETIGECIGVVRNSDYAIGIQALNPKTIGGYPAKEDDVMPMYDIFDSGNFKDISLDYKGKHIYRGNAATAEKYGSRISAYTRNRSKDRIIENWGHKKYVAPAYQDGGVVGSKIALFGCPADDALDVIGEIEVAEGLPHPTINGKWAKTAKEATASYIIMDFGEHNIKEAIEITKVSGQETLYHSGPFSSWGHFKLRTDHFPNGWDGFKLCVDQARKQGINIGFHTLSNFTGTNDRYVTPVPDKRLAKIGETTLSQGIDASAKTIPVENPDFFTKKTTLNTVMIGTELIQYQSVSESAPWNLLGCAREAFGTTAVSHSKGATVGKLMDHGYKVFLTNMELGIEEAERIAEFCNYTGAKQLSFDGLEGNWSTGMGQYGRTLFTKAWYDKLKPELKGKVINDASNPGHYNWHMYTRMNWGEPWYAGFRESQTLYRLKNQYFYTRNLMPRMLGWFALRGNTSVEDAEWLLARAAGFDAGFALVTNLSFAANQILDESKAIKSTGQQNNLQDILTTIREWEKARMAGAFPSELKPSLQDISKEFHLKTISDNEWELYPVYSFKANVSVENKNFTLDNPHHPQALSFIIQNTSKQVVKALSINGAEICDELKPGEIIRFASKGKASVYNGNWKELRTASITSPRVLAGEQEVKLNWADSSAEQKLKIELRTIGVAHRLKAEFKNVKKY